MRTMSGFGRPGLWMAALVAVLASCDGGTEAPLIAPSGKADIVIEEVSFSTDLPAVDVTPLGGADTATGTDVTTGTDNGTVGPGADASEQTDTAGCSEFGCPCTSNSDCDSEYCIDGADGRICTSVCVSGCDDPGFDCVQAGTGADLAFICMPRHTRLCRPCRTNDDCAAPNETSAALCIPAVDPNDGSFCGSNCENGVPCPDGYACSPITLPGGGQSKQCVPVSGMCECRPSWSSLGLETDCALQNGAGKCAGTRTCGPNGLTSCEGAIPHAEVCNGLDDDCDGTPDNVPSAACVIENTFGSCPGTTGCNGNAAACVGKAPAADTCNGLDDNCDGTADNGACDDKLACTDDVCSLDYACQNPIKAGFCLIGGQCYAAGAPNPGDPCESCIPGKSTTSWSDGDGSACNDGNACTHSDNCLTGACTGIPYTCEDGLDCTIGVCDGLGGCTEGVGPGQCKIDGKCRADNDVKETGSCLICNSKASQVAWTTANAIACNDGNTCTSGDTCNNGTCVGSSYSCDDQNPCTFDACTGEGGCTHDIGNSCVINGQCVSAGTTKPGEPCLACQPGLSKQAWTGVSGAPCDDQNTCSSGDTCQAGVCTGNPYSCNDSLSCTTDICDGSGGCSNPLVGGNCLIAGTCYGVGVQNPSNPCQKCGGGGGTNSWSNNDGASCTDNEACTTGDVCSGGACGGSPTLDSYESNNSNGAAKVLGNISDSDNYPSGTFTASLYPGGDEDWFRYHDDDGYFASIFPRVEILGQPVGVNYDLCVYIACDSSGSYDVTCDAGSASSYAGMQGCCSTAGGTNNENVVVNHNCSGSNDSANVYVRVYQVSGPASCGAYTLRWGDD